MTKIMGFSISLPKENSGGRIFVHGCGKIGKILKFLKPVTFPSQNPISHDVNEKTQPSMEEKYPLEAVEEKWQHQWASHDVFKTPDPQDTTKPSFYVLEMFPYPSGTLHMGHARNYTIGDVLARYRKALGYNVLHPMGWDACGLPAENAALKHNIHPKAWTYENARIMKEQCLSMGFSHDWSREIFSCDPQYYKHEQKIFLDFLKKGLAYRKESYVNWDPVDHCVLANEQVIDGRGWRSGAIVEKKLLNQWFLAITKYNHELLESLKTLEQWPEAVKTMQENWIGRSKGCIIDFPVIFASENDSQDPQIFPMDKNDFPQDLQILKVFTTRPETLYGATFCALAWDHPLCVLASENSENPQQKILQEFCQHQKQKSTANAFQDCEEKEGVFTGLYVQHPLLETALPLYAANYVRLDYGSGAVMGCPSHDDRDGDFARKYGLKFLPILNDSGFFINSPHDSLEGDFGHKNYPLLNGLSEEDGFDVMVEALEKHQKGQGQIMYRLKDWGVGRQRYWGVPIPVIYCPSCGTVPVPDKDLPVELPEDVTFDTPGNPLDRHATWKHVLCPLCGEKAQRETDTFDTFMESSWYFGRFCDPHNREKPFDEKKVNTWLPVNNYVGGIEHAVLHLLYARFFTKALRDCGYWSTSEPFQGLFTQGMVCHKTYKNSEGQWLYPQEVEKEGPQNHREISTGKAVVQGRSEKMSKSKNNVVGVSQMVQIYGADAVRLFLMSDTPPQKDFEWSDEGIQGSWRYVRRVWAIFYGLHKVIGHLVDSQDSSQWCKDLWACQSNDHGDSEGKNTEGALWDFYISCHEAIHNITLCLEDYSLNKAVAHLRQWSNNLETLLSAHDFGNSLREKDLESQKNPMAGLLWGAKSFLVLLSPFMPHISQEIASIFGLQGWIHDVPWPKAQKSLFEKQNITLGVQVNGKLRGTLTLPINATQEEAMDMVHHHEKLSKYVPYKRFIYIPGRMISIIV